LSLYTCPVPPLPILKYLTTLAALRVAALCLRWGTRSGARTEPLETKKCAEDAMMSVLEQIAQVEFDHLACGSDPCPIETQLVTRWDTIGHVRPAKAKCGRRRRGSGGGRLVGIPLGGRSVLFFLTVLVINGLVVVVIVVIVVIVLAIIIKIL
jgi:hypothetical protein